jgi:hypothetical protein
MEDHGPEAAAEEPGFVLVPAAAAAAAAAADGSADEEEDDSDAFGEEDEEDEEGDTSSDSDFGILSGEDASQSSASTVMPIGDAVTCAPTQHVAHACRVPRSGSCSHIRARSRRRRAGSCCQRL